MEQISLFDKHFGRQQFIFFEVSEDKDEIEIYSF